MNYELILLGLILAVVVYTLFYLRERLSACPLLKGRQPAAAAAVRPTVARAPANCTNNKCYIPQEEYDDEEEEEEYFEEEEEEFEDEKEDEAPLPPVAPSKKSRV